MDRHERGCLLRIYVSESDRVHGQPLYEAIVLKARELHLAGATVVRGHLGFGAHSHLHAAKLLRLSQDLPILIEIIDTHEQIDAFLPHVNALLGDGLVTLQDVRILGRRPAPADGTS